jgi:hypothetical protein
MAELLTRQLHLELEKTNNAFSRWAANSEDELTKSASQFQQNMEECDHTIIAIEQNINQLEEVRVTNAEIKETQKQEFDNIMKQTTILKDKNSKLNAELQKYEYEEAQELNRLEKTRSEHDNMRNKMEKTLNDLTHGIRLYTSLGLEFQKADSDCMKFIFTQISSSNPSKQYYFTMYVDDNDKYQLVDTKPKLPTKVCNTSIIQLNEDNNIGKFVVNMRNGFKEL